MIELIELCDLYFLVINDKALDLKDIYEMSGINSHDLSELLKKLAIKVVSSRYNDKATIAFYSNNETGIPMLFKIIKELIIFNKLTL